MTAPTPLLSTPGPHSDDAHWFTVGKRDQVGGRPMLAARAEAFPHYREGYEFAARVERRNAAKAARRAARLAKLEASK